jgi:predicted ATPase
MLKNINIQNFKSLKAVDIPLRKINIIIGKNNSGKSSSYQPLILLQEWLPKIKNGWQGQTQSPNYTENIKLLFGKFQDFSWKKANNPISLQFTIELDDDQLNDLNKSIFLLPYFPQLNISTIKYRLAFIAHPDRDYIDIQFQGIFDSNNVAIIEDIYNTVYYDNGSSQTLPSVNPTFFSKSAFNGILNLKFEQLNLPSYQRLFSEEIEKWKNSKDYKNSKNKIILIQEKFNSNNTIDKILALNCNDEPDNKIKKLWKNEAIKLINDSDWQVSLTALNLLMSGSIPKLYNEKLIGLLESNNWYLKRAAAKHLKDLPLDENTKSIVNNILNDQLIIQYLKNFILTIRDIIYLSFTDKNRIITEIRIPPWYSNKLENSIPKNCGYFGENVMPFLLYTYNKRDYLNARTNVQDWLGKFGGNNFTITPELITQGENATHGVYGTIDDQDYNTSLNIANIGFGLKQLLPIIVECFFSPKGSTIIIDEPELHLHSENQMQLIDMFIEVLKEEKQIILVTHSEDIFLRLQRRIAEGTIKSEDVGLLYFSKDKINGSQVSQIPIKKDGKIPGWLPGVQEISQQEFSAIFKSQSAGKK